MSAVDFPVLRHACAETLSARGAFDGAPGLRAAFEAVPREHFVPDRVWLPERDTSERWRLLDRQMEPVQWVRRVYDPDTALITQLDDGAVGRTGPAKGEFTSSLSCPSVVVWMLRVLGQVQGAVLEIGTGYGYGTALLRAWLTPVRLTTMDIDSSVAEQARRLLADGGWLANVITGDGEAGHEAGAPYAGIIATGSVYRVPPAWLKQLSAGGVLVMPVATPFGTDALLRLVGDGQGGAAGRFVGAVAFMRLRGQREPGPWSVYGWGRLPDYGMTLSPSPDSTGQRIWLAPGDRSIRAIRVVRSRGVAEGRPRRPCCAAHDRVRSQPVRRSSGGLRTWSSAPFAVRSRRRPIGPGRLLGRCAPVRRDGKHAPLVRAVGLRVPAGSPGLGAP
ncbi:protein-L-isoaspartate(D-aspartate) O-methyltransferase [Streptomyces sp. NPDC020719]|uniref:protein-L-isoaspartate O-methyltransferase family protein n=1 Tax=Streptomyces sp. NPDC020719 TaxID=3154896 RepID=UPI0033D58A5C